MREDPACLTMPYAITMTTMPDKSSAKGQVGAVPVEGQEGANAFRRSFHGTKGTSALPSIFSLAFQYAIQRV